MRQTILARRYAKALFALGKQEKKNDVYSAALKMVAALVNDKKTGVEDAIVNPLYPIDVRRQVIVELAKSIQADRILTNFFTLLINEQRANILPDIAQEFQILTDKAENISHGTVISAIELDAKLLNRVQSTLEKFTGNKVILETKVDTSIIGGIIAKVGDLVLDGSIQTQLIGLKESIKGRE